MSENITVAIPCNDRAIFIDEDGTIAERMGMTWKNGNPDNIWFIDDHGYVRLPVNDNPYQAIIGHRGDKVHFKDLALAFEHTTTNHRASVCDVLSEAKQYLDVDCSDLSDTVVLSVDVNVFGKFHGRVDVETESFPAISAFIDLSEPDYKRRDEKSDEFNGCIIPLLVYYSSLIGKRVNVEVYFRKDFYSTPEKIAASNEKIFTLESMFLPRLRKYINQELDKILSSNENARKKYEDGLAYEAEMRSKYRSEYDLDPNKY